jgi:spermidine synthase
MQPWTTLDVAAIPSGGELRLKRRGAEFSIMLGANELMNSRLSHSEEALATLAADRLSARPKANVLIGGLGFGFTLRAALASFGPEARITVAELVPQVCAWARGPLAELFNGCLDDGRVTLLESDVAAIIMARDGAWDAILLDVDNGPDGLTTDGNDALYGPAGLAAARQALRAGGLLAVWSAAPDQAFGRRMGRAGFRVEERRVHAHRGGGARHVIWLGARG